MISSLLCDADLKGKYYASGAIPRFTVLNGREQLEYSGLSGK
jgi:hypothetical protein